MEQIIVISGNNKQQLKSVFMLKKALGCVVIFGGVLSASVTNLATTTLIWYYAFYPHIKCI